MKIGEISTPELAQRLASPGVRWRVGPFVLQLRSPLAEIAPTIGVLYAHHPLVQEQELCDLHLQLLPGPWHRRIIRRQAWLHGDGTIPFAPFARSNAIPLLEWGLNWATASRANHWLILHAAALERNGRVLLLPARPLSGKSTLCAALTLRGWRLFSDEMALVETQTGLIYPVTRPLVLKNDSIPLIRALYPHAVLGPEFPKTRKGTVAHLQPPAPSVAAMAVPALPAWVVAPRYTPDAPAQLQEIPMETRFIRLAGNAFNFEIQGRAGFHALDRMVQTCSFHEFIYSDLNDAAELLEALTGTPLANEAPVVPEPVATGSSPAASTGTSEKPSRAGGVARRSAVSDETYHIDRRGSERAATPPPPRTAGFSEAPPRFPGLSPSQVLWQVMRTPALLAELNPQELETTVRLARSHHVLARLEAYLRPTPLWETLPSRLRHNLTGAAVLAQERQRAILWEINRVQQALRGLELPILLLKGAAYASLGLELARGRMLADLDLLVAEEHLEGVEGRLLAAGWQCAKNDPYDQRYYREWMHELPPLTHPERGTEVDLHHALLPRTSRLYADPRPLWEEACPLPGQRGLWHLAPSDMVLHAAVHLFHDGALEHALRDLADLDGMLREFSTEAGFWDKLLERARRFGWQRPLHYALRYAARWMETPIPGAVTQALAHEGAPAPWVQGGMDWVVRRMVSTDDLERRSAGERVAWFLLYCRSHFLRMPLGVLLPHLARQGWRRWVLGKRGAPRDAGWPPRPGGGKPG